VPPNGAADEGEEPPAAKPAAKPEVHENPLLSDAKAFLGLADDADAGWLKTTRDWLRGSADGKPPTRWQQLGRLDRVLRDELAASLNRRAEALGITLKAETLQASQG
jgi:hypothetical protein